MYINPGPKLKTKSSRLGLKRIVVTGIHIEDNRSEKTPGSKYSSTSGLSPRGHLERQRSSMPQPKTRPDSPVPSLQGPCDRSLKSEVPCGSCLNWR